MTTSTLSTEGYTNSFDNRNWGIFSIHSRSTFRDNESEVVNHCLGIWDASDDDDKICLHRNWRQEMQMKNWNDFTECEGRREGCRITWKSSKTDLQSSSPSVLWILNRLRMQEGLRSNFLASSQYLLDHHLTIIILRTRFLRHHSLLFDYHLPHHRTSPLHRMPKTTTKRNECWTTFCLQLSSHASSRS